MDPSRLQFVWLHRKSERPVVIAAPSSSPFSGSICPHLLFPSLLERGGPDKKMDAIDGWMDAMAYEMDEPIPFSSFYFSCYYVYIIAHVPLVCLFAFPLFSFSLMIMAPSGSCVTTRWSRCCCCGLWEVNVA